MFNRIAWAICAAPHEYIAGVLRRLDQVAVDSDCSIERSFAKSLAKAIRIARD